MTDRDRKELAEVFALVLDSRLNALRNELAQTVVTIIDCVMNDLAGIMESQNENLQRHVAERTRKAVEMFRNERTGEEQDWLDQVLG